MNHPKVDIIKFVEGKVKESMKLINEAKLSGESEVQKFYDGAVVFITGGSGFIGQQLIEKLIRTTNVKKLYVLLRAKKGKNIQERLETILDDPLYSDLRKENPSFVDKIIPILGDVSEINLGIDEKSWAILTDEVNVVLHSAATINFAEKMKLATITNVRGTREMLKLAKACKNIKAVVHISTAYSNATASRIKQEINEDFYDSPIPPDVLIELSETLDSDTMENMCRTFMNEWPNSYTLTKAVAEQLARREKDLPICVVRPTVVSAAYKEPTPGWINPKNVLGPSGILVGLSLGVLHVILADKSIFFDFVPVDYVNNAVLVAAWKSYLRHQLNEKDKKIYTVSNSRNPFQWGLFQEILVNEGRQAITSKSIWYCCGWETKNKAIYFILMVLFHFIPALIVDGCCLLLGIKPRLVKAYQMVEKMFSIFGYFTMKDWFFEDKNTMNLYNELSKTDKILFNFDVTTIEMRENVWSWMYGTKKYILKDDITEADIEYTMKKQFWFKIANYIVFPAYLFCLFKLVSYVFIFIYSVLSFFFSNSVITDVKQLSL